MPHQCKICGQTTKPLYTLRDITYEHCSKCNFLQNFYWEDHPDSLAQQTAANDKRRAEHWPAGELDDMYRKGWETLELMLWPLAWFSRKLHQPLKSLTAYRRWVKKSILRQQPKLMDFGCGHGTLALELRRRDELDIIGLDPFSPTEDPHILRKNLSAAHFPDNFFDGIITIETMEHITDILPTFHELQRILKPGGVLFVQTRRLEDADYQKQHEKWFYLEDPKTHVSIYSELAMRKISEKTGFSRVQFRGTRTARLW